MDKPRSVEELTAVTVRTLTMIPRKDWAEVIHDTLVAYAAEQAAQAQVEWENPTGAVMSGGVVDWKKAYQFSQAELKGARAEERKRAVGYLQVLQANHPHLRDTYRHAELNLQAVLETDWQPDATALRART